MDIDAQMDAYIAERDHIQNYSWKKQKPLSVALFRLLDQLSQVSADYNNARDVLTTSKGCHFYMTTNSYPFDPETIKQATAVFYREQRRLHKILIDIADLRKQIANICVGLNVYPLVNL